MDPSLYVILDRAAARGQDLGRSWTARSPAGAA